MTAMLDSPNRPLLDSKSRITDVQTAATSDNNLLLSCSRRQAKNGVEFIPLAAGQPGSLVVDVFAGQGASN